MTATRSTQRQHARPRTSGALWLLYLCDAGLLVASGLIHLHLWDIAYRHVKTLDVLFLVQVAACLSRGPSWRSRLSSGLGAPCTVLVVEAAAVVLLGITALLMPGPARSAA